MSIRIQLSPATDLPNRQGFLRCWYSTDDGARSHYEVDLSTQGFGMSTEW